MNNTKNVIYTLSDIYTRIQMDYFIIKNEMLGEIKQENISDITIGSFTSENKFEDKVNEFFNDKNKKLCLIKFNCDERHFLNYVKSFLENKEKDNENVDAKNKKAFVFIVCLERFFKNEKAIDEPKEEEKENEERNKNETISLTTEFYQIFIDDLNGEEQYAIKDLINLKGKELFEKFINYEQRLSQDVYETFTYMDYNLPYSYRGINEKNYIRKLINYILSKKDLQKKINDVIMNQMEKDENILSNVLKVKNLVNKYDTNIISSIKRYLNKLYTNLWNNFYYKVEKDQFFSSLLSSEKEEEEKKDKYLIMEEGEDENEGKNKKKQNKYRENINKKIINLYLENFKFEEELNFNNEFEEENKKENKIFKVIEEIEANPIDIFLGLNLPGIYPIISYIIKRCHSEIAKEYASNESKLRRYIKDLDLQNEKTKYYLKLKSLNDQLKIDLEKIVRINKIAEGEIEINEFFNSFLEDYYTIFIYNNLGNYIKNLGKNNDRYNFDLNDLKNMLKFLVGQRNKILNIEKIDLESIAGNINWIEYYSIEISYIL